MANELKALMQAPGFAMPMMRGFPTPVGIPMMGADSGPTNGMGFGWANVAGYGVRFFLSVHAGDGMTLMAELDYARYKRLAELMASAGKQAGMVEEIAAPTVEDPLTALGSAEAALAKGVEWFEEYAHLHAAKETEDGDRKAERNRARSIELRAALNQVRLALGMNDEG